MELQKQRARFLEIKKRLRDRNVIYSMLYPARLRIVHEGSSIFFTNPEDAAEWLRVHEGPNITFPLLTPAQQAFMDAEFTLEEVEKALTDMASGKAPGPDGFPIELYRKYRDILAPLLLRVFQGVCERGSMPDTFYEANIILLKKEGKDPLECGSYRPISLVNVDYKVFTKILATRLNSVILDLIHPDQTGFMPGETTETFISNNAHALLSQQPFFPLMNLQCSPEVDRFLCMAFVPECTEPKHIVLPCRATCETVYFDCKNLIDTFDIAWPPELECDRLEDCTAPKTQEKEQSTNTPAGKIQKDYGFWCPRQLKTFQVTGYKFLGVNHCAPPCPNMYFTKEDLDFAKNFIGIISIICLCATLFTFLTFLIDVKRFRYPERPIIFYSVCYSIVSLIYFIGFAMGNSISCNEAHEDFADEDTVVLGSQNKACTVIFMLLYFCTMAGTIWWVMLTITWYLAAGQKWSCEAIEQKSMWFHTVAWGIPGILTIILLAMNKVEGDNISGVCFVGLYDQNVSTYFVLLPLCFSVFIGLSLLLAGIISLNNVRQVIQHDERNQEKLKKFMIRIGVFSGTYLVPLGILLCCNVHELLSRSSWEMTWVADHCLEYHIPCPYQPKNMSRPDLGLFLTKYVMTLIVGISAIFWVGSKKTCSEWANFFHRNQKQDKLP
ncbi:unnamed protein product [Ranitomeya imitator]|uniref:Frizzled-6 n=1 Tax=Ranitomeya imitator TaxID=111125 RepID=A0ABN9LYM1_9NEOB|nr:unnamed protein product [Ranitomeya imitator]